MLFRFLHDGCVAVQGAGAGSDLRNCLHLRPGLTQRDWGRPRQPQHELQPQGGRGDGAEAGGEPREGVEHCPVMTVMTHDTFSSRQSRLETLRHIQVSTLQTVFIHSFIILSLFNNYVTMCILFCNWCTILDPHSDIGFNWIEYNSNRFIRKYS